MSQFDHLRKMYPHYANVSDEEFANFLSVPAPVSATHEAPAQEPVGWLRGTANLFGASSKDALANTLEGVSQLVRSESSEWASQLKDSAEATRNRLPEERLQRMYEAGFREDSKNTVGGFFDAAVSGLGSLSVILPTTAAAALAAPKTGGLSLAVPFAASTSVLTPMLAGSAYTTAVEELNQVTPEQLMQSPDFRNYYRAALNEIEDPEQAFLSARKQLTDDLSKEALYAGAFAGAGSSLVVGPLLSRFIGGATAGSIPKSIVRGAQIEGIEETFQSGTEAFSREYAKSIATGQPLDTDLAVRDTLFGTAIGATAGGVLGAPAGLRSPVQQANDIVEETRRSVAERGGDALDQEVAASEAHASVMPEAVRGEMGQARNLETVISAQMADIDALSRIAMELGGTEEVADLQVARRYFQRASEALKSGDTQAAQEFMRNGEELYRRATATTERALEGDLVGGQLAPFTQPAQTGNVFDQQPDPAQLTGTRGLLNDSGIIYGQEPADVTAARQQRQADDFSARYGQEGQTPFRADALQGELDRSSELPPASVRNALPPGTGQIDLPADRPNRTFTPISDEYAGVGRNIVERQAQTAPALPQGNAARTITQAQMMDLQDQYRQAIRTPVRNRTPAQVEAVQTMDAVRNGEVVVESPQATQADNVMEAQQAPDPQIIMRNNGQPFKTELSAKQSAQWRQIIQDGGIPETVAVEGGFAIRPAQDPQAIRMQRQQEEELRQREQQRARQARQQEQRRINPDQDELLTAIAKAGGLNRAEAEAQGIDPSEFGLKRGIFLVFNNGQNSMTFDQMAENLSQYGYVNPNYTVNELLDKVQASLSGTPQFTPEGSVNRATLAEELNQQTVDQVLPEASHAETQLMLLHHEAIAAGIPEARVLEILESNAGDYTGAMLEVMDELSAQAGERGDSAEGIGGNRAIEELDTAFGSGEVFTPEDADRIFGRPSEEAQDSILTAYSEADLSAREESLRQQREAEELAIREAEQKARADAELGSFTLTGSNRVSDVAAAAGQNDMFGLSNTRGQQELQQTTEQSDTAQAEQSVEQKPQVSENTIFTEDAAAKAREILRKKLGQLNSGIDPEVMQAGITLAGYHIEKGARTFAAYAKAMVADMGDSVKPYLKSWYMGVKYDPRSQELTGLDNAAVVDATDINNIDYTSNEVATNQEVDNANSATRDQTADSANRDDVQQGTEANLRDGERGSGRREADTTSQAENSIQQELDSALDNSSALAEGEQRYQPVRGTESAMESDTSRGADTGRGSSDSTGRLLAESKPDEATTNRTTETPVKVEAAKKPRKVTSSDISEIKSQMPFLTEGQAQDVVFAEQRFDKGGLGVVYTNGTGTGKTFTGLGIAYRQFHSGKKNILIIAPKQPIVQAWQDAGKKFFGLDVYALKSTTDGADGHNVVVTTYANLASNDALMNREWDLLIPDEAQYLSSDSKGSVTNALTRFRALARQKGSEQARAEALNPELYVRIEELSSQIEGNRRSDDSRSWQSNSELEAELTRLKNEARAKVKEQRELLNNLPDDKRGRAVMLSATPFAYEKNVVLGQGFLYDWNKGKEEGSRGYNAGSNFDQFMMQHFGYRMRYNKLTEPDANVDRGLMQRGFNAWLKKEGVLSGRSLDSDFDYDRRFVLTESAIGRRVDEALKWVGEQRRSDNTELSLEFDKLSEKLQESFDYQARMYFLEAIKAREVVDIIKQHHALGRKVLVLHDFKQGGTTNPFNISGNDRATRMFREQFKDLAEAFDVLGSPITTLSKAFPDALIYNGSVSGKNRVIMQDKFNADDGANLMVAQGDAMREGVSIHDRTGNSPRVMIHLGLPNKPTAAIQQEGRTYRTGQASNAMFRYLTIGTSWERMAFADKIAGRASTAENLALGEQARGLKESFITAYENADQYPPGFEGEGTGGKSSDQSLAQALTPWDMAKSLYWATKKQGRGRNAEGREQSDYFATPEPVGLKMVELADIRVNDSVLEPSAGHGAIARWFPENSKNRAIELTDELASQLALRFNGDKIIGRFEDHNIVNKYDAIVMNPPFGSGGKLAAEHVGKAIKHLRDGGRIVALIPRGPAADKQFNNLLYGDNAPKDIYTVAEIMMPSSTFERAGTSVATRILVLEKQSNTDLAATLPQISRDYSSVENINDLFDRLETLDLAQRSKVEAELAETGSSNASAAIDNAGELSVWNAKHTKTGADLYMAKFNNRLERDEYRAAVDIAKKHNGYYSRFGKPGFLFNTEADRQAFVAEFDKPADAPDIRFSRRSQEDVDTVRQWSKEVAERLNLETFFVSLKSDGVTLALDMLKAKEKNTGVGTQAMTELASFADAKGYRIALTPGLQDERHGTTSRARLVKFYKRFGFVENKGRNKDFTLSESMYREPSNPDIRFSNRDGVTSSDNQTDGVTQDERIERLNAAIQGAGETTTARSAMLDSLPEGKRQAAEFAEALARNFGQKINWVRTDADLFDGVTVNGDLFVDLDSAVPYHIVMGHELTHILRNQHPDLYAQLEALILPEAQALKESAEFHKYDQGSLKANEEYVADVVGNRFGERQFWADMAAAEPNLFRRVATIVRSLIERVTSQFRSERTRYGDAVRDLNKVRAGISEVMMEYRRRQKEGGTQQGGSAQYSRSETPAKQTDTKAFKNWFGDSKVVDANGEPMVVYHGTGADFTSFSNEKKSGGQLGDGFYFAPQPNAANMFAKIRKQRDPDSTPNIIPAYLSLQNPYIVESRGEIPLNGFNAELLADMGHDGVIVKKNGALDEITVFNPTQIKSATGNQGTFDPNNPDIRFSLRERIRQTLSGNQDNFVTDSPAITPRWKEFTKLRAVWDSASDVLRRNAATRPIAEAIDSFYDGTRENMGTVNTIIDPVSDKLRKAKKAERTAALKAFEQYMADRENGRNPSLDTLPDLTQEMVNAWAEVADVTGTINQQVGVKVFDAKIGQWRDIGKIGEFWPRKMKKEIQQALLFPNKHHDTWRKMAQALYDDGRITENTYQAASEYLGNELSKLPTDSQNDYFAGVEKARGLALPEAFYDYSWDAGMQYKDQWAEATSRIQALGQRAVNGTDLIDQIAAKITDKETLNYLKAVQDRIYNTMPNDAYVRGATTLNTLATGLQLGNPATALLNIIGGTALNFQAYGFNRSIRALGTELMGLSKNIKEARQIGILIDDYLMLQQDAAQAGMTENLQKFTTGMLKWGGYTPMETFIRTHGYVVAKTMLRDSLASWSQNIESKKSLKLMAWYQRNGFDTDKLIAENGDGPETRRLYRKQVNLTQGSYRIDQTPVFVDSPIGKFLFKYQKFGTQLSRLFWINHLKPFMDSITKGGETVTYTKNGRQYSARVRTFMPMLNFFGSALVAGTALAALREAIFGYNDPGPDLEEIEKALEDDDTAYAVALGFKRAWASLMAVGAFGFFGNYAQMVKDVSDRQRVKSPIDPPALAPLKSSGELAMRFFDQKTLTARDIGEFVEQNFSFYRTGKRASLNMLAGATDFDAAHLEVANRDRTYIRKITRRYADDIGLENRRRAPSNIARTEMSPANRALIDAAMLGNTQRMKAIVREQLSKANSPQDAERMMTSMKAALRAAQPARVSISPSERERQDFLNWAKERLPESSYQRILDLENRYTQAAIAAGLMNRPNQRQVNRDRVKNTQNSVQFRSERARDLYLRREFGL